MICSLPPHTKIEVIILGKRVKELLKEYKPAKDDPQGSYTGKPENPNETPVQDADDL
jgi:hypothetical protein